MPRKDKNITPSVTQKIQSLGYSVADWDDSLSASKVTKEIRQVLLSASKKENGKIGIPDRVYVNVHEKLLILVEEKPAVKDHDHPDKTKGAISGVKWYLSRFFNLNLIPELKGFFDNWKILGIAVSGDLSVEYQHKFNCYVSDQENQKITPLNQVTNFMSEGQFLALFNSLDEEKSIAAVSTSSKKINQLLRQVDSQKRPVLLSALMICLHKVAPNSKNYTNDFREHYKTYSPTTIITNVISTVRDILEVEGIPREKLDALNTELAFLTTDLTLNNSPILKDILLELETAVIPLFNGRFATNSNYDIIGKFYEEFLKYAGVSNVKKGIVLTPRHITTLFTKLVDLKDNDRIVDLCCGTGAFLIAGMNALTTQISRSDRTDKDQAIANVKANQLLGFELNTTMYICAVSNMLFRGDGKSSIHNYDSIYDTRTQQELDRFKPTIGFINPPYAGKENSTNPTPKEITFLVKLLDNCSRYGIIIAPVSTFFKDDNVRQNILKKHTLKSVINMPNDLFQPNAATHTAIAVFETNRAFNYEKDEVTFYDLKDDGFALSKNKGRTDIYGKWFDIEEELLNSLKPGSEPDDITLVRTVIKPEDEWTIYAHSKTDYSTLTGEDYVKPLTDYVIYGAKKHLGIVNTRLGDMEELEAVGNYLSGNTGIVIKTEHQKQDKPINTGKWTEYSMTDLFDMSAGKYYPSIDYDEGDIPLVSASETGNGVMAYTDLQPLNQGNSLTIGKVGMSVYYQDSPFCASPDVTILTPLFEDFDKLIALFIVGTLSKQKHQWNYGNQIRLNDSQKLKILLPTKNNKPDWDYMREYIRSLPYSEYLETIVA